MSPFLFLLLVLFGITEAQPANYEGIFHPPASVYASAVDSAGNIYLAGSTRAPNSTGNVFIAGSALGANFPATSGAYQTVRMRGHEDGFVLKLNASGSAPIYATLVGGTYADIVRALAIDDAKNAYIGGYTASTAAFLQSGEAPFPVTPGTYSGGGQVDVFITKVNATGSALVYSAVFGGSADDSFSALTVDAAGSVYFAGATFYSPDFPTTPDADQPCFANYLQLGSAVFAAKLNAAGAKLLYSTFATDVVAFDPTGAYYSIPGTTSILSKSPMRGNLAPALRCVVNAASYGQGAIAPGEIIPLIGPDIGPEEAPAEQLESNGRVSTDSGSIEVLIAGIPAPLLYVSKN